MMNMNEDVNVGGVDVVDVDVDVDVMDVEREKKLLKLLDEAEDPEKVIEDVGRNFSSVNEQMIVKSLYRNPFINVTIVKTSSAPFSLKLHHHIFEQEDDDDEDGENEGVIVLISPVINAFSKPGLLFHFDNEISGEDAEKMKNFEAVWYMNTHPYFEMKEDNICIVKREKILISLESSPIYHYGFEASADFAGWIRKNGYFFLLNSGCVLPSQNYFEQLIKATTTIAAAAATTTITAIDRMTDSIGYPYNWDYCVLRSSYETFLRDVQKVSPQSVIEKLKPLKKNLNRKELEDRIAKELYSPLLLSSSSLSPSIDSSVVNLSSLSPLMNPPRASPTNEQVNSRIRKQRSQSQSSQLHKQQQQLSYGQTSKKHRQSQIRAHQVAQQMKTKKQKYRNNNQEQQQRQQTRQQQQSERQLKQQNMTPYGISSKVPQKWKRANEIDPLVLDLDEMIDLKKLLLPENEKEIKTQQELSYFIKDLMKIKDVTTEEIENGKIPLYKLLFNEWNPRQKIKDCISHGTVAKIDLPRLQICLQSLSSQLIDENGGPKTYLIAVVSKVSFSEKNWKFSRFRSECPEADAEGFKALDATFSRLFEECMISLNEKKKELESYRSIRNIDELKKKNLLVPYRFSREKQDEEAKPDDMNDIDDDDDAYIDLYAFQTGADTLSFNVRGNPKKQLSNVVALEFEASTRSVPTSSILSSSSSYSSMPKTTTTMSLLRLIGFGHGYDLQTQDFRGIIPFFRKLSLLNKKMFFVKKKGRHHNYSAYEEKGSFKMPTSQEMKDFLLVLCRINGEIRFLPYSKIFPTCLFYEKIFLGGLKKRTRNIVSEEDDDDDNEFHTTTANDDGEEEDEEDDDDEENYSISHHKKKKPKHDVPVPVSSTTSTSTSAQKFHHEEYSSSSNEDEDEDEDDINIVNNIYENEEEDSSSSSSTIISSSSDFSTSSSEEDFASLPTERLEILVNDRHYLESLSRRQTRKFFEECAKRLTK